MAAKTDQKARLLDLTTSILELTRDEDRDYEPVCNVLQIIKDKKNFAEILLSKAAEKIGNVFEIVCQGSYIASELIRRGKYDWAHDWITDERFPIAEHAPCARKIELVEFDHDPTSEEVLRDFTRSGLKRPTFEDALYFGVQHPEGQRKHPIVFLHEPVQDSHGNLRVLVLGSLSGKRDLSLVCFDGRWSRYCVFAGIRE